MIKPLMLDFNFPVIFADSEIRPAVLDNLRDREFHECFKGA